MIIIAYQYYLSLLHYGKTVRIIRIVCSLFITVLSVMQSSSHCRHHFLHN